MTSLFLATLMALNAGVAVDIHSSMGNREINPLVGTGRFGMKQTLVVSGTTLGSEAAQVAMWRHLTRKQKIGLVIGDAAGAVVHGLAARHNYGLR